MLFNDRKPSARQLRAQRAAENKMPLPLRVLRYRTVPAG
jgi:hypothetical protein